MRQKWIMGNWKMNGSVNGVTAMFAALKKVDLSHIEAGIAPPAVYIQSALEQAKETGALVGGQDVSEHASGAYTGEIAADMYQSLGVQYVLVGHSERRAYHHETNALVAQKASQLLNSGLRPVVCLGETLKEREAGLTESIISSQLEAVIKVCTVEALKHCVIAYEPVWAIGTGVAAAPEQVQQVHQFLRNYIADRSQTVAHCVRIVYGGSVKPSNAQKLFDLPDVDGGLIGGASLKPEDFTAIINAAG